MKPKLKKSFLIISILILVIIGIVSINNLDRRLISTHQHFLYCELITPGMSTNDALRILKSVRSSDFGYDNGLHEVWGSYSDPLIKHLFGGPARLYFKNGQYMDTSIAVEGSTWIPVKC
jgi:hypothetical protein